MLPTFSIITPSFNQGQFIEDTINSVLSQEGEFFIDYIIMDGGSTDESKEIISKYDSLLKNDQWEIKCKGIRFRWVSERDEGQVDAIRKGFAIADGDIGIWLNSDDIFHDERVCARVLEELQRDRSIELITGDGLFIDKGGRTFGTHQVKRINLKELLYLDYHILQPATFIKTAVLRRVQFDPSFNFCFDAEYFIRLISTGVNYRKIDDTLACFRLYPETKTLSGLEKRYAESLKISRIYGRNHLYQMISAVYKYFEIVLQNRHPRNMVIKAITNALRIFGYITITGKWYR